MNYNKIMLTISHTELAKLMMSCGVISEIEENSRELITKKQLKEVEKIITNILKQFNHEPNRTKSKTNNSR